MNLLSKLFIVSIIIIVLLVSFNVYFFFIKKGVGLSYYKNQIFNPGETAFIESIGYMNKVKTFQKLNEQIGAEPSVVFIGDSLTEQFQLSEYLAGPLLLNRGISGDTTAGLLKRLRLSLEGLRIETMFIMIGINDMMYRGDEEILSNITRIVDSANAKKIVVQSILPVKKELESYNSRIRKINESLRLLCEQKKCIYIDLHSEFLDAQKQGILPELTTDGVHLTPKAYALWSRLVSPLVATKPLMSEKTFSDE